jgi:hypothetical protein
MTGDAQTRFCAVCNKNVHDLGSRTREEAEALIASGRACVRTKMSAAIPALAAATVVFSLTAACTAAVEEEPLPQPVQQQVGDADGGPTNEIYMLGDVMEDPTPPSPGQH